MATRKWHIVMLMSYAQYVLWASRNEGESEDEAATSWLEYPLYNPNVEETGEEIRMITVKKQV